MGEKHGCLRLLERYCQDGVNKLRIIANLYRKVVLAAHLEGLIRILQDAPQRPFGLKGDKRVVTSDNLAIHGRGGAE